MHRSVLSFHAGKRVSVPNSTSDVNGLIDGPRTRALFTLIHLSLMTLQGQGGIKDGTEGVPSTQRGEMR